MHGYWQLLARAARPWWPLALLALAGAPDARAAAVRSEHAEVELVAEVAAVAPGQPFWAAVRMKLDPHWHTYWINYGDAGSPITFEWKLPPGWTVGPVQWPAPIRIPTGSSIMSYGYEGEFLLPMKLTPPADLALGGSVTLAVNVDWLECEDICLPGNKDLSLALSVAATAAPDAQWKAAIEAALAALPQPPANLTVAAWRQGDTIYLGVGPKPGEPAPPAPPEAYFYSLDGQIKPIAPQIVRRAEGGWLLEMTRSPSGPAAAATLPGVLRVGGNPPLALDPPLGDAAPAAFAGASAAAATPMPGALELALTLAFGFLGGLILNIMPCVFPVLGLKIMSFVKQAGQQRAKVVAHGLVFTAGVLLSMWALAGVVLWLRQQGGDVGWGFQLQEPGFVLGLTLVLVVFGLSLSGVFDIGLAATGAGGALMAKQGYAGTLAQGVLAVVVATPCTAPFLGTALGAAFTLPPVAAFAEFTAIALGLAAPYLLLSFYPSAVRWLPKPGAWMETFKQFMAFLLYAAAAYLLFVLAGQVQAERFLNILIGLVVVAMAAWFYGRFAAFANSPARRHAGVAGGLLLLGAGTAMAYWPVQDLGWEPWSAERVAALQAEGRPIYVDFTARWCATCQANKLAVFSSQEVLDTFARDDVALLKGDWTNKDPALTAEISKFGPPAVPLNLLYVPGRPDPLVLPKLLTPGIVLDALKGVEPPPPTGQ